MSAREARWKWGGRMSAGWAAELENAPGVAYVTHGLLGNETPAVVGVEGGLVVVATADRVIRCGPPVEVIEEAPSWVLRAGVVSVHRLGLQQARRIALAVNEAGPMPARGAM